MADPRFFTNRGPFTLAALAELTGARLSDGADSTATMEDVAPLDAAGGTQVSFLDNRKYLDAFRASKAGACFVRPELAEEAPNGMALLVTDNPYLAYAQAATHFYPSSHSDERISPKAHIHPTAKLADNVTIAPGAVIGAGVEIGNDTSIGANVVISHALIGQRVIIHPGVSIGQDGFGFAVSDRGAFKVPQLGRVVIEDDVEIGANTTIDRGAGPDTHIGQGTKIDNLVQIGHNVRIGRFATIVSQVGISGSSTIGDGAVLAGQVGVAGHLKIGAKATIAAKSGVTKSIPAGEVHGGIPAIPIRDWRKQVATVARLIKKRGS